MSTRSLLLVSLGLSGCATAGEPGHEIGTTDAAITDTARPIDAVSVTPPDTQSGSCAMTFSGVLATWDLTGQPGSQASTPASTPSSGVTAGNITRAPTLTAVSGADSINASGWTTGAQRDSTKYCTLSITPPAGCSLDLTSLAFDVKSSGTGPAMAVVATSDDIFVHTVALSTTTPGTADLTVTNATDAVEIRIYGYAASGGTGTMRVENVLSVSGALH